VGTDADIQTEIRGIIDAALRGELTQTLAARVYELGREATIVFSLAITAYATSKGGAGPHAPPASIPVYAKPPAGKRRGKPPRPGARDGHEGHRRPTPPPDRVEVIEELKVCPACSTPVLPARRRRRRTVEDIPADMKVEVVQHDIPQQWCPCCKTHVEPRLAAAMPNATLGNGVVALAVVMHYGLGLTIEQVREIFASQLRTELSAGGLVDMWRRAAEVLLAWYEQIGAEARTAATLHADETGWRVSGDTHWLWCFCNPHNCYYMIEESRGGGVLKKFFTESFKGVLMSDFWSPYQSVALGEGGERQCCLAHLLRELEHVDTDRLPHKPPDGAREWSAFVKMLRRLLRDGIRLRERRDFTPERYASRIARIDQRLIALAEASYGDTDASRLASRLSRHRDELFTFLDRPEASWENNFAERQIRPAVILRKNSQCNRSERGAATQAVLMSVYRTLKLRGHDPRATIEHALRHWSQTGQLPPLPTRVVAGG
jgi:hypothetical protein